MHLRVYPAIPTAWLDAALGEKWKTVRTLRRVVTGALELERAEKRIGSSLQAAPHVHAAPEYVAAMKGLDLAEICITSGGELVEGQVPDGAFTLPDVAGVAVVPALAQGDKCARCWQVLEEVGKSAQHPLICRRCEARGDRMRPSTARRWRLVVVTLVVDQRHQAAAAATIC